MGMSPVPDAERLRVDALVGEMTSLAGVPPESVRVVRSPYRVCPLGAHVDHQLGAVTGMAVDRALLLAFAPRRDGRVELRSRQFPNAVAFDPAADPARRAGDWADYARGAAFALRGAGRAPAIGMTALVDGHADVAGLSSSAAAGVAYLLALEAVNGLAVSAEENIELDRIIENDFIGLNNGILDQACILLSRRGRLTWLDCRTAESTLVPAGSGADFVVIVLFSGLRRVLADTDYNRRVAECGQAAARLVRSAGRPATGPCRLGDVEPAVYRRHGDELPERLKRRARHFFTEQERVRRGVELWRAGDMAAFGRLMTESGRSSIVDYECGNRYLRTAYDVLCDCPGVWGARFSGAGFRGCCIGLAQPGREEEMAEFALSRYLAEHPDMRDRARVYFCRSGDGAGVLRREES